MTIMKALDLLDQIIDESDPDVSVSLTSNHYMKHDVIVEITSSIH